MINLFWYSLILVDIIRRLAEMEYIVVFVRDVLYCIVFFYMVFNARIKHYFFPIFFCGFGYIILIVISLLLYPVLADLIKVHTLLFFGRCLVGFFLALNIVNWESAIHGMAKWHWIGLAYSIMILQVGTTSKDYMSVSYNLLIPAIVTCSVAVYNRKVMYLVSGVIMMATIILYGARGPVCCAFVALIFLIDCPFKKNINIKVIVRLLLVILFLCPILYVFEDIADYLHRLFPDMRNISLLMNGQIGTMSGRDKIYQVIINSILDVPFIPHGLLADRILLSGDNIPSNMYPHNFILEIIYQFGIIGVILFAWGCKKFLFVCFYKQKDAYIKIAIASFILVAAVSSMFSGSYIANHIFWFALGTLGSISKLLHLK